MHRREILLGTMAATGALILADKAKAAPQVIEGSKQIFFSKQGTEEDTFIITMVTNHYGGVTLECEDPKASYAPWTPVKGTWETRVHRERRSKEMHRILLEWFETHPPKDYMVHVVLLKQGEVLIPESDPFFAATELVKRPMIIDRGVQVAYNERRAPYRAAFRDRFMKTDLSNEPLNSHSAAAYFSTPEAVELQGYNLPEHDRIRLVVALNL